MQTEAEAFLQRIRAYPDDDTPRLIFADWLEEQGGADPALGAARARLIRVQIALAHLTGEEAGRDSEAAVTRLAAEERELLAAYRTTWAAGFRGLASGLEFRRGFVEEVKVAARQFIRHAHEVFAAGPVRHVHLLDVGGSLPAVLQSPYLSRLRALTVFAQHAGEPLARSVSRCPHLSGLRSLHLGRNRLADDAAEPLASSPVLGNLEHLDLSENDLGETAGRALAASPHFGNMRVLELAGNRLGPAGAEALAGSERLTALERLGLAGNEVGAARLHSLSRAHDLLRVPVLDLPANGLNAAGLQVILTRPPGPVEPGAVRVRRIDLGHNDLGDAGARVIAACPHLAGLRELRLAGCGIGDDGARALAESPHLNQLVALDLGNNPIADPGFRAFLDTPHMRSLCRLGVPGIGVSIRMRRALEHRYRRPRG